MGSNENYIAQDITFVIEAVPVIKQNCGAKNNADSLHNLNKKSIQAG